MRIYKFITRPAYEQKIIDYTLCDLCREKIQPEGSYDKREIDIQMDLGSIYPEGGMGTKTYFDICEICFRERLIPWFESQGAKPTVEEWDW